MSGWPFGYILAFCVLLILERKTISASQRCTLALRSKSSRSIALIPGLSGDGADHRDAMPWWVMTRHDRRKWHLFFPVANNLTYIDRSWLITQLQVLYRCNHIISSVYTCIYIYINLCYNTYTHIMYIYIYMYTYHVYIYVYMYYCMKWHQLNWQPVTQNATEVSALFDCNLVGHAFAGVF